MIFPRSLSFILYLVSRLIGIPDDGLCIVVNHKSEAKVMSTPPEDLINDALTLLGSIKEVGKIKKGSNEVTKSLERGTAKILFIAEDVSPPEIIRHLPILAKEKNIAYLKVPSSKQLGEYAGINVGAASVAIVDAASAEADLKSIIERAKQFN